MDHARAPSRRRGSNTTPTGNAAKFFSYAAAFGWIKRALANGYFLQAVTLEESIISDRLISYLCWKGLLKPDTSSDKQSLATLIAEWRKVTPAPIIDRFFEDLQSETDNWRKRRNAVVHGTVKSIPGSVHHDIKDFKAAAREVAEKGLRIAKSVCNWYEREKRKVRQAHR